jgi:hypothetical protein
MHADHCRPEELHSVEHHIMRATEDINITHPKIRTAAASSTTTANRFSHTSKNPSPSSNSCRATSRDLLPWSVCSVFEDLDMFPGRHYAYPPPDIPGHFYNDANAPWQYPPALKHTVSDPGAHAYTHAHAGAPHPGEPNPFGAHPSMQRWGSDLGGGGGYGIPDHDRHSGQAMQFQPPWASQPAVDTAPGFGHNHEAGFMGDVYGRHTPVQPGAWSGPNLAQATGRAKYTKKRSMPVHAVTRKLSERAGRRVEAGNIRANLYDLFGDKSSITCKAVVATILDGLTNKVTILHKP